MTITIETTLGPIRGENLGGHQRFRGIPYAAPPIGALRFAATQPAKPWQEVLDASRYGFSAWQPPSRLPGMEVGPQDEDCLTLNVYTPAADGARRPVLFWIHGGGFVSGGSCQPLYEGRAMVERGDVVLVTINYRLGALGYVDLPEVDGVTPNAGQLDQIAALEFVRDNIERFGGDPGNVTIFGESAGGMAVSALLAMPGARGLFHKAIAQSGAAAVTLDRETAARITDVWLSKLGLSRRNAGAVRDKDARELIAAQVEAAAELANGRVFLAHAPMIDEGTLPQHPLEAVRAGAAADVPFMTGTTRDEWRLFEMPSLMRDIDARGIVKRLSAQLPEDADVESLVSAYADARGEDPADGDQAKALYLALQTDRIFRMPAIQLAEAQAANQPSTWMYRVDWPSPARRGELGACHAIELPFVFGTLDAPGMDRFSGEGPDADRLSERMMDAWLAFARTGRPGHDALPDWEPFETGRRTTFLFDRDCTLADAPMERERRAWKEHAER